MTRRMTEPQTEKRCTQCNTVKPASEFYRARGDRLFLSSWCVICKRKDRRARRAKAEPTPGQGERFWTKVAVAAGCWLWTGGKTTDGYGRFFYAGTDRPAHHIPFYLAGLEIPKWPTVADHVCKVRHCVNPMHVRWVSQSKNALENSESPFAKNKRKVACDSGHVFTPDTTAWIVQPHHVSGRLLKARMCLVCYPAYWNNPARVPADYVVPTEKRPNRGRPAARTKEFR